MTGPGRYPQELRERAVRLVFEHQDEHAWQWAAITSIAYKFGSRPGPCASGSVEPRPMTVSALG
jgi:transposase-like protein